MALAPVGLIDDSRVSHHKADLNGRTYHYLLSSPESGYKETVFLIHGWPDLSIGWRYQIPLFLQLGMRVVCPDMMGFGETEAPKVPPESMASYGFKRAAKDMKELAAQLGSSKIILGGHDWGGAIVYRIALWCPELVKSLFSVCTPFTPLNKVFTPLETAVQSRLPNFTYQLQLASGEIERVIVSRDQIKCFLNGIYGGRGPKGERGFVATQGIQLQNLALLMRTPFMSEEMLDFYTDQYLKSGLHSTLNYYRNREQNFQDELQLEETVIQVPVLFIAASNDEALPLAMSASMEKYIPNLTRKEVRANHWALWECPGEVNEIIKAWLETEVFGRRSTL